MTFPTLKTGAVAQYPLNRGPRFQTQAVRFMDGSLQRYRIYGTNLRRWVVKLDLLDEQELGALIAFVEQQGGAAFAFTDPLTGDNVANCMISGQAFTASMTDEMNAQATVSIEEFV
jgi:hypothetical protein